MADLLLPFAPKEIRPIKQSGKKMFKNPFTGAILEEIRPGAQYWVFELSYFNLSEEKQRTLSAFFGRIMSGDFIQLENFQRTTGTRLGPPTVSNAAGTVCQYDISVAGMPTNSPKIFAAGDFVRIQTDRGDEFKEVAADLNSDSLGRGTLKVWPMCRNSAPINGSTVYGGSAAYGRFRLDQEQFEMNVNRWQRGAFDVRLVEAL